MAYALLKDLSEYQTSIINLQEEMQHDDIQ